jgi:hypothetical protein
VAEIWGWLRCASKLKLPVPLLKVLNVVKVTTVRLAQRFLAGRLEHDDFVILIESRAIPQLPAH